MSEVLTQLQGLSPGKRRELLTALMQRRRAVSRTAPLSYAQQRLWFLEQLVSGNPYYNETSAFRFSVPVDAAAFERSLHDIVRRHEALRTVFVATNGEPRQRVLSNSELQLSVLDRSDVPPEQREAESARLAQAQGSHAFNLAVGPLLRVALVRFGPADFLFVLTMHHIVCDGWSMGIFFEELRLFYEAHLTGRPTVLPPLPLQYVDFAIAQRERLTGSVLARQIAYWRDQLADVATLELQTDFDRPLVPTFSGSRVRIRIPAGVYAAMKAAGEQEKATPFMVLLALYQVLFYRYTGQDDIAVGCPIANRNRPELEMLIGFFVNSLVMRTDLSGNPTFREVVRRVREVALSAYAHQDVPFERLVEELQPKRDPSRNPLFQVTFQMLNPPTNATGAVDGLWQAIPVETATAKFDLRCDLWESDGGVEGCLEYSGDLFRADTAHAMARHFEMLAESVAVSPSPRVAELPMLSRAEEHLLVTEWNRTEVDFRSPECVHEMFERHAATNADAVAIASARGQLTFGELNRQANQLARHLRSRGVGPGSLVAVLLERSIDYVLAILAVLKAGAAYVPLDPAYPSERLAATLTDSLIAFALTHSRHAQKIPGYVGRHFLDTEAVQWVDQASTNLKCQVDERSLAYVVFTSGSTGRPKGVEVLHSGLSNLVHWHRRHYEITARDRGMLYASPAFDASVWEMWPYLASGATLWIPDESTHASPSDLARWMAEKEITVGFLPTPVAETFLHLELPAGLRLRALLTGGDKLHAYPRTPLSFRVFNHYGPTENTVVATFADVSHGPEDEVPPIGRPIANVRAYVLDRGLRPVPVGVKGELYLAGRGLARGYLNDANLTPERFLPDPFDPRRGSRMYRTGDVVRYRRDGNLEFHGRVDRQVKVRGSRTEPGDIETALNHHPAVSRSLVVPRETAAGETSLVAYVVRGTEEKATSNTLTDTQTERTDEWRNIYETIYQPAGKCADPAFNIIGWNSSYTGQPLSPAEMQEQIDATVERIAELGGRRILEIGCGTGLLLFRLAGKCERYDATDFSANVVASVRQECERRQLGQVQVMQQPADDFAGIEPGSYDGVVLNSVVQYFPGTDYLMRVLAGAVRAVRPGGWVFVGDVRSRPLLRWLHAGIELARATDDLSAAELRARIDRRIAAEQELVIEPEFFAAWGAANIPDGDVKVEVRRGRHANELVKFRYDVVLAVGERDTSPPAWSESDWEEFGAVPALAAHLRGQRPAALLVLNVPSARLAAERRLVSLLDGPQRAVTARELKLESTAGSGEGADPEELWGLENELGYTLRVGWSGPDNPGSYNVWCVAKRRVDETRWAWRAPVLQPAEPKPWSAYANTLAGRADTGHRLAQELRDYLRQRLPEHMVPAQFVWLDRLPLTPNGKLDRRALPDVGRAQDDLAAGYIAPGNQLEGIIAEIWSEVLGIERVGVNTNFFDLGGHSLLLVRVHSALKKSVQTSLSVIDLFLHPTVRALAEAINGNGARGENVSPHSFSRPPAGFPLNPQTVALT